MPKKYAMGGRAPSALPGRCAGTAASQTFRERLGALRNLPPFLKLVWQTSPALTLGLAALRIVRALLPVVTLYVGKLIIDEVVLLAGARGSPTIRCASGSRAASSTASAGCSRWSSGSRSPPTCSAASSRCSIRCCRSNSATRRACG